MLGFNRDSPARSLNCNSLSNTSTPEPTPYKLANAIEPIQPHSFQTFTSYIHTLSFLHTLPYLHTPPFIHTLPFIHTPPFIHSLPFTHTLLTPGPSLHCLGLPGSASGVSQHSNAPICISFGNELSCWLPLHLGHKEYGSTGLNYTQSFSPIISFIHSCMPGPSRLRQRRLPAHSCAPICMNQSVLSPIFQGVHA